MNRYLITTYCFESGLWYLAKAIGDQLAARGNFVVFAPKARYYLEGRSFVRTYPEPKNENDFKNSIIIPFTKKKSVEDLVCNAVKKYNIDTIISFETLMERGQWVASVKSRTGVKVIDVPMIEWVTPQYLNGDSYNVFDEIWCLTDLTKKFFKCEHARKVQFNLVDSSIFYKPKRRDNDVVTFYHAGSLNAEYSSKNTNLVLEAFSRFIKEDGVKAKLIFTGSTESFRYENHDNILHIKHVLNRSEIGKIYRESDVVLVPSQREGLGLSLYEAKACGCKLITTNAPPMNEVGADYFCAVDKFKKERGLIPLAIISSEEIYIQIKRAYKDIIMEKVNVREEDITIKTKSEKDVAQENASLLDAFMSTEESEQKQAIAKPEMNLEVLAALKARKLKKMEEEQARQLEKIKEEEEKVMPDLIDEREVSINIGVIGVGQAGSRIAEQFHKLGYDVGVINTSAQDLKFIDVLPNQKLLLGGSLGGTGKDLDLGREIFSDNVDLCAALVESVAEGNDMLFLAMSGGGGTGSSSVDTMVDICSSTGMPLGLIYVLPKATEDAQSKKNAIETLARLARMTSQDKISCLVVVDNARIEQIYGGLGQSQFWNTANNAIVEPIHLFNSLTSQASKHTSLDPSDFGKIISCGDCSVYGMVEIEDYMDEITLAEAMMDSLNSNMLAEGFDLRQARVAGAIIIGSEEALDKLPAINIDYAFHVISEQTNGASIYRGVYAQDGHCDGIRIYTWFAGLGLPQDRIENLKKESESATANAAAKIGKRADSMNLDLGENKITSIKDEIHRKIQGKKSGFGKLQGGAKRSLIDRRKK